MILKELKQKILTLIEEYNPESPLLTDDDDISAKHNDIINQNLFEVARIKKLPKYCEIEVSAGETIDFSDIEKACGYEVYQVGLICGVTYCPKASGTVFKMLQSGTAEIDCFVYPERITAKTKDSYELELSADALEVLPYGIAADLLLMDNSSATYKILRERYETMLNRLDTRYQMPSVSIEGGVMI